MFQQPDLLQTKETDVTGALLRLAETIAGHTHLDTLLPTVVELAATVTGCDGCVLSLWDEHRARFLPAAAFGLSPRLRRIFYRLPVAPGDIPLVDEMVRRRDPVSANAPDPLLPAELWRRVNAYTVFGVPLLYHERVMGGMIMLRQRGKKGCGPRQTALVKGIARQTALAIASARAFEAERRRRRDLETLQETIAVLTAELEFAALYRRIVQRAAITFAAPAAALILCCPTDAGYMTCRPLLEAGAGQASMDLTLTAAHGLSASYVQQQRLSTDLVRDLLQTHPDARPFALPDLRLSPLGDLDLIQEEGLRAALVILLQRGEHFLGLLTVYRRAAPLDFDDDALALAQTLGHQTVIALENARLYQQAQDRSRQLAQVLAVGHQVRANQDTTAILQHIAAGIRQGLNWGAVLIARYDPGAGRARGVASAGDLPPLLDRFCHFAPLEHWRALYEHEQYRISRSYFVAAERGGERIARESATWDVPGGPRDPAALPRAEALAGGNWQPHDLLIVPIQDRLGEIWGVIVVDAPQHGQRPALADVQALEIFADQAAVAVENVQLYTALQVERGRLRALSTRLTQAQEAERTRIARELHDEAGQALTAVRLQLDFVTSILPPDVPLPVRKQIRQAQDLIGRTLQEIRRISIDLRPSLLDDLGLTPALRWQCDHLSRHANLAVHFECKQDARRLEPNVETAVYRAAQEALTNIVRHAQATAVGISLAYQDEHLDLTISDNGRGFPDTPGQEIGLGLIGIRERLSAVGGALHIDSQPGSGSTLHIQVPLSPHPSLAEDLSPPQEEAL